MKMRIDYFRIFRDGKRIDWSLTDKLLRRLPIKARGKGKYKAKNHLTSNKTLLFKSKDQNKIPNEHFKQTPRI